MEIARVFFGVHMAYGFQGLAKVLVDNKMKIETLKENGFIVFMNSKMTAFKLLVGPHYIVYYNNKGKRVPLEAISQFPSFFNGKTLDFKGAERKALEKKYSSVQTHY